MKRRKILALLAIAGLILTTYVTYEFIQHKEAQAKYELVNKLND